MPFRIKMSDWSSSEDDCELIEEEPSAAHIVHREINESSFANANYNTPQSPVQNYNNDALLPPSNFKIPVLSKDTVSAETWDLDMLLDNRLNGGASSSSGVPKKNFIKENI
jgi:hypothetical protein